MPTSMDPPVSVVSSGASASPDSVTLPEPRQSSRRNVRTLMVVDLDKVFCRYMELSIERSGKYRVEAVNDSQAALDVLSNSTIDAILCSLTLSDMDGLHFVERVRRQRRWRDLPMFLVADEFSRTEKLESIKLSVDALISKPVDLVEFEARLETIFANRKRQYDEFLGKRFSLAGDFNGIPFCDLISLLEMGKRNGRLSIVTPRASAELTFRMGRIAHVSFANLYGANAFYELMREPSGSFEFLAGPTETSGDPLPHSSLALLLEGARRIDTQPNAAQSGSELIATAERRPASEARTKAREASGRLSVPFDAGWIALLEQTFEDEFGLGEMRLFAPAQLAEWTTTSLFKKRFHVFLICDLTEGIEAMASIASPLGTSEICAAFSHCIKTAGLLFALPGNRMADIVLIDQNEPDDLIASLGIRPSMLILAPGRGDWLSISVKARMGLVQLLAQKAPEVILCAGGQVIEEGLAEILRLSKRTIPVQTQLGALGEPSVTIRDLLLSGLDFWKQQKGLDSKEKGGHEHSR